MKSNILLITQGASRSDSVIADAAVRVGRGLRHASSIHEAFDILAEDVDNIDVVVVDVDPGSPGLSILDALSYCRTAPAVIVITDPANIETAPMACRHGATACITRPFTALELAALIHDICFAQWHHPGGSCDRWGHPSTKHRRKSRLGHSYERLHCMSL